MIHLIQIKYSACNILPVEFIMIVTTKTRSIILSRKCKQTIEVAYVYHVIYISIYIILKNIISNLFQKYYYMKFYKYFFIQSIAHCIEVHLKKSTITHFEQFYNMQRLIELRQPEAKLSMGYRLSTSLPKCISQQCS